MWEARLRWQGYRYLCQLIMKPEKKDVSASDSCSRVRGRIFSITLSIETVDLGIRYSLTKSIMLEHARHILDS